MSYKSICCGERTGILTMVHGMTSLHARQTTDTAALRPQPS